MNHKILNVMDLKVFYKEGSANPFKNKSSRQILDSVSFSMEEGEILGLVGESGSGKSSLAKAVLNLIPYKGTVIHTSDYPQMIFQDPYSALNPAKKVKWILEEPLRLTGKFNHKEREDKVYAMLQKVGLDEKFAERYPSQLSGGQRQRVCIAGALMLSPKLLIADEPVSALDVTIQAQILELLKSLHEEMGLSVLLISHDLRVVYKMCDRVIIMHEGHIVEQGTKEEVYFAHKHAYTEQLLKASGIE